MKVILNNLIPLYFVPMALQFVTTFLKNNTRISVTTHYIVCIVLYDNNVNWFDNGLGWRQMVAREARQEMKG